MNLAQSSRRLALTVGALMFIAVSGPAVAQDIADTHLAAARSAVSAMGATMEFDGILPQAAQALKSELIQKNPDLQATIVDAVDRTALSLASRRGDLEREAAIAYARVFSEAQLGEISQFYSSETGKKLMADGPIVAREVFQAADIWQRGIARDLAQQVAQELEKIRGAAGGAAAGGADDAGGAVNN